MHKYKLNLAATVAIIALFICIAISGCKKEDATVSCSNGVKDGNEVGIDCGGDCSACSVSHYRVKRETFSTNAGQHYTIDYFYLPDGRIDSSSYFGNLPTYKKYTYPANKVIESYSDRINEYTLNTEGYAASVTIKDTQGYTLNTYTYNYDTDGHRIYNGGAYAYVDGNLMTISGSPGYSYTYTDKPNTISSENKGQKYLGKDSRNLAATITAIAPPEAYSYTYQFDSLNRVVRVEDGRSVTTYSYY